MDAVRQVFESELGYVVLLFGLFVVPRVSNTAPRRKGMTDDTYVGALVVYAVLNTTMPGIFMRTPAPVYDAPTLPAVS